MIGTVRPLYCVNTSCVDVILMFKQGRRTGYGWYSFHRTRFFWSRLIFLSFYSEYVNEFRLPYLIPNSIVKFTFRIHSRLLLFHAKVERQLCLIAIFCLNIFPAVDAMESAKWRACVLACFACFTCFTCLACSCVWSARVLSVLTCLAFFTCLACSMKWRAWRASENWRSWRAS